MGAAAACLLNGKPRRNAEFEAATSTVVHAFTTGAMVPVFVFAQSIPADARSGNGHNDSP
jgi:hypothetical protein